MEQQFDYDTEQTLRVASGLGGARRSDDDVDSDRDGVGESSMSHAARPSHRSSTASISAKSQTSMASTTASTGKSVATSTTSEDKAQYANMTINTRRRLIRKPLPDVPGQQPAISSSAGLSISTSSMKSQDTAASTTIPSRDEHASTTLPQSVLFARHTSPHRHGTTLEEARKRTLDVAQKERGMLEWWPDLEATTTIDTQARHAVHLDAQCYSHLTRIVESCLQSTHHFDAADSQGIAPVIVAALQECVGSLFELDAMSALQQTSSVLWRVDALVRSNDQLSGAKGGLGALLGVMGGVRWPRLMPWRGKDETSGAYTEGGPAGLSHQQARVPPPMFNRSASGASYTALGTEQRRRKRDVAMQLLNNAFWMAGGATGALDDPSHFLIPGSGIAEDAPPSPAMYHSVKRKPGGAPNLLSKPVAPIVALAESVPETTAEAAADEASKKTEGHKKEVTSASVTSSVLTTRLASQLRSAPRPSAEAADESVARASISRPASQHSTAEHTATHERVKISICKVCTRFDDEYDRAQRRRSDTPNTIKLYDGFEEAESRHDRKYNDTSTTSRSDKTVKGLAEEFDTAKAAVSIVWKASDFDGEPLHLNPLSTDIEGREFDDGVEGVNVVGGTFIVSGVEDDDAVHDTVRNTLDVGLYAALAMLLERSYLADFDVLPKENVSNNSLSAHFNGTVDSPTSAPVDDSTGGSTADGKAERGGEDGASADTEPDAASGHWPRHIWHIFSPVYPSTAAAEKPKGNGAGLPRTRTMDGGVRRRDKVMNLGRIITSLAGNVYKRTSTSDSQDGAQQQARSRAHSEAPRLLSPEALHAGSDGGRPSDAVLSSNRTVPRYISPYREQSVPASASKEGEIVRDDYMEALVSKQSISLVVVEGLDATLPFARQGGATMEEGKKASYAHLSPLPSPALSRSDAARTSMFSASASAAPGATQTNSRLTTPSTRETIASSASNQSKASSAATNAAARPVAPIESEEEARQRREVLFYQRGGSCRDTSLGQAVEEMAAKALALKESIAQAEKSSKKDKSGGAAKDDDVHTYKIAQYLHGRDKIFVCASVLAERTAATTKKESTPGVATEGDADEVARLLKTDEALAQTALQLADHIQSTTLGQQHNGLDSQNAGTQPTPAKKPCGVALSGNKPIEMWHADMRTGRQSAARAMSHATYLASFGTFLEALMECRSFTRQSPTLLGADEEDNDVLNDAGDDPKHDLVRLFKIGNVVLKFHIESIVVYDLHIEGPVVLVQKTDSKVRSETAERESERRDTISRSLVKEMRLEIQNFFASVKSEVARMEQIFVARELDMNGNTIKPPSTEASSSLAAQSNQGSVRSVFSVTQDDSLSVAESDKTGYSGAATEPLELLTKVQTSMRKAEFELYETLREADVRMLNDVRHRLQDRAKSAKNRLTAWSRKHLRDAELKQLGPLQFADPFYFHAGNHAFPGSHYVLRQDEPLSIIAYSLSSRDFAREMSLWQRQQQRNADVQDWRASVAVQDDDSTTTSSFLSQSQGSAASSAASMTSSRRETEELDPDEDEDFSVPEPLEIQMKRKKRTRDVSILSLRIRSSVYSSSAPAATEDGDSLLGGGGGETNSEAARADADGTEASERSQSNGASTNGGDDEDTPNASRITSSQVSQHFDTVSSANETFSAHVSTLSRGGPLDDLFGCSTIDADEATAASEDGRRPPSTAGGSDKTINEGAPKTPTAQSAARMSAEQHGDARPSIALPSPSSERRPRLAQQPRAAPTPASPHIKQSLLTGNMKISCVSWFAEDFARLRNAWNVEEDYVGSLSRSKAWGNVGGKSKSGFFLTRDNKWIAKQLLNVWTVDEKEAFLEFAPTYLRYMTNSVANDCPTLLVKIAGVYSLKIKDVKTGEVKLKLSVQVLENVFAGDGEQSLRFDLKGVPERRITSHASKSAQHTATPPPLSTPTAENGSGGGGASTPATVASVWWDGEWIEAMKPRAYVMEKDKAHFRRALRNDLAFLTASNVMDYSLLVGVHEGAAKTTGDKDAGGGGQTPAFRVRIVDFLGAWTLVKQLESSSKKAIKSQAPTVIPPQEYAARFSRTIESYFISCPAASGDDSSGKDESETGAAI